MKHLVTLKVNGEYYELAIDQRQTLADVIRNDLELTGTKEGCGLGSCGSCTVIMDGKTVLSCMILAIEAQGRDIMTIEGLGDGDNLHPIQQAFIDHNGLQCGFCTPGMIMSATTLLKNNPSPSEDEIRFAISGNLCRCTGYDKIVESIQAAAQVAFRKH